MKSEQTNLQHYYSEIIVYYVAGVAVISSYITNKFDDLCLERSEWRQSHHGKKKCDLRDPGSLLKAHSSCTIENWHYTIVRSLIIRLSLYLMETLLIVY